MTDNQLRLGVVVTMALAAVALLFVLAWSDTTRAAAEQCHALGGVYINHTCQTLEGRP